MQAAIKVDPLSRALLSQKFRANMEMCWTCQCCNTECPVNIATSRLFPATFVRMANLGLLEELLQTPALWYCQSCNRCTQVCPMNVQPAAVIEHARTEAMLRNKIPHRAVSRIRDLYGRFQRVRFYIAKACLEEGERSITAEKWRDLLEDRAGAARRFESAPENPQLQPGRRRFRMGFEVSSCFTCSECSNVCPIFYERPIFDPQWIFRMVNLGFEEKILRSPSIWLCLGCRRCTQACSQLVRGHQVVEHLQKQAVSEGYVPADFIAAWQQAGSMIYPPLLAAIDAVLKSDLHLSRN